MQNKSNKILLEPNRANQLLNSIAQSHWFWFCLMIFICSRLVLWQQLMWINTFTPLHLSPLDWLNHFDSKWYVGITSSGYSTQVNFLHHANYVYFPVLPLLSFLLSQLTHLSVLASGQILCNLFFLASLCLFYHYLKFLTHDELSARFSVVLLAFSPFNIYFSSFYTESLFLFFSLAAMLSAYQKRWWVAGIMGLILSALRPNGIMILIPLCFMAITQYRKREISLSHFLTLCLIPLGLISYMVYLYHLTGDMLAYVHNEAYWGRNSPTLLVHSINLEVIPTYAYDILFLAISLSLMYFLLKKNFFNEALYFFCMLFPAILSSSLVSMARYSACLFTFYLALVLFSYHKKYLMLALLLIETLYFGTYVTAWINGMNILI